MVNIPALSSVGGTKLQDTGHLPPALAAMWTSYVELSLSFLLFYSSLTCLCLQRERKRRIIRKTTANFMEESWEMMNTSTYRPSKPACNG